jgi:hypothetical protein
VQARRDPVLFGGGNKMCSIVKLRGETSIYKDEATKILLQNSEK